MSENEIWNTSYPNPITAPLNDFVTRLRELNFSGPGMFPNILVAGVISIVIGLFALFWIYGILVNIQRRLWDYIIATKNEMNEKNTVEKVPYTITIGIFFIVWIPFIILCSPYYLIGLIGHAFASETT